MNQLFRILMFGCCLAAPLNSTVQAQYDGAQPVPEKYKQGFHSISEQNSQEWLSVLAGAEMAGRGTGQEGYQKAARWYADQLQQLGFQPAGPDGSWFQPVPFVRTEIDAEESGIAVQDAAVVAGSELGLSGYFGRFQHQQTPVFARLTAERPAADENQYADRLLIVQAANRIDSADPFIARTNPACVLVVVPSSRVRSQIVSQTADTPSLRPAVVISVEAANRLAQACGVSSTFFSDEDPTANLQVQSTAVTSCRLQIERESIDVPNVAGWLPGTDESLRHEHVCLGAHLDHLGEQRGVVYPGADDNGSGATSVLQVAKAIHAGDYKPPRSVLLIAFCAEERGLLGSKHYVSQPLRPLQDMVCMLNIDMIGRNEETADEPATDNEDTIHLVGSKRISDELHQLTLQANQYVNFEFEYDQEGVYTRSDHHSFARHGVPVTFLFGGFNPHYHKPTDTLDGINYSKIANCARLNYLTLMMAAEHGHFEKNADPDSAAEPAALNSYSN